MDAIGCGIVKLSRVPVADNIPGGEMTKKARDKSDFLAPYNPIGSTQHVNFTISRVICNSDWEAKFRLVVEIKGYRREDAKEKKTTMETYWIPGVNNLGQFDRWAFAESTEVFRIAEALCSLLDGFARPTAANGR